MKMNIYAHVISAVRRSDGAGASTTETSLAYSMEESISATYKGALARWPISTYSHHQVVRDISQQIPQQMIDAAASR